MTDVIMALVEEGLKQHELTDQCKCDSCTDHYGPEGSPGSSVYGEHHEPVLHPQAGVLHWRVRRDQRPLELYRADSTNINSCTSWDP